MTWPLAANITTGVAGSEQAVDSYQHIWHQWWVAYALTHGQNPFFTNLLYYPEGIDLFWQTLGFTQGLLAVPITLSLGSVAGVNFTVFSSFVIGGYAVFLLTRRLTGSMAGALVAGTIYAFSPYHLQKMSEGSIHVCQDAVNCNQGLEINVMKSNMHQQEFECWFWPWEGHVLGG